VTRAVSILVIALIAACGGGTKQSGKPEPASGHEETIAFLRKLGDRACACKDAACAQAIDAEIEAQMREEIASGAEEHAPPLEEGDQRRFNEQFMRLWKCLSEQKVGLSAFGVYAEWELQKVKDRACACSDAACAKRAMADWNEALAKLGNVPGSDRTLAEIKEIDAAAQACFAAGGKLVIEEAVLELKALRKRACACPDDPCRSEVKADFSGWVEANRETHADQTITDEVAEIARELGACMAPRPDEANATE